MSDGWPRRASLTRQLTGMNMFVTTAALLLAVAVLLLYDLVSYRAFRERTVSTQAQIVGANSASALVFDNPDSALDTLQSLRAAPDVVEAHIYDATGAPFVSYAPAAESGPPPLPPEVSAERIDFSLDSLWLTRPIVLDDETIGYISIRSSLEGLYGRLARYAAVAGVVVLVTLAAALLLSRIVQRAISSPLISLAAVAHRVADGEGDYAMRAAVGRKEPEEIASVVHSFNEMLSRIQQRDAALQRARDELEERVQQRTLELNASNQELEAFSYSVSHDLRAPLRHVAGFAALLQQHTAGSLDATAQRYVGTIIASASRMGRLIDDLLAFSRVGRASLARQPVDLERLVADARSELAPDMAGREIQWQIGPLPAVSADPALLRLVVLNLLSNAIKYTQTRPVARIEVGALVENLEATVYVRDNGVGFDMKYVGKLFGVFQRLHSADEFSGTGIGLANVRRIIGRHGGRTWAEGEVDGGATFFFTLQVDAAPLTTSVSDANGHPAAR